MIAIERFVEFWKALDLSGNEFIHPADKPYIRRSDFEIHHMPVPIIGNIIDAEVIVLALNPGYYPDDDKIEKSINFKTALKNSIEQDFKNTSHSFVYLDPDFANHSGAWYWGSAHMAPPHTRRQQRLLGLIKEIAQKKNTSLANATKFLANKIAILEQIPYHSKTMSKRSLLQVLPSAKKARELAHEIVQSGEKLVIVTRAAKEWGFTPTRSNNLIVYPPELGASASLQPHSEGGAAILQRLL